MVSASEPEIFLFAPLAPKVMSLEEQTGGLFRNILPNLYWAHSQDFTFVRLQ